MSFLKFKKINKFILNDIIDCVFSNNVVIESVES
jgi:hypothetical protein